jgi:hypothetical protein
MVSITKAAQRSSIVPSEENAGYREYKTTVEYN